MTTPPIPSGSICSGEDFFFLFPCRDGAVLIMGFAGITDCCVATDGSSDVLSISIYRIKKIVVHF